MKCPYCNAEMERGYVQSRSEIFWSRKIRKLLSSPKEEEGDAAITDPLNLLYTANENSYLCRNCNKVIIDIDAPYAE